MGRPHVSSLDLRDYRQVGSLNEGSLNEGFLNEGFLNEGAHLRRSRINGCVKLPSNVLRGWPSSEPAQVLLVSRVIPKPSNELA